MYKRQRPDYAIKCFNEALAIEEDFETLNYLSQLYIQTGEFGKAHELLERMIALEPELTSTYLTLANLCFCLLYTSFQMENFMEWRPIV